MSSLERELLDRFSARLATNRALADLTSFRIGGPADLFLLVETDEELAHALHTAYRYQTPTFCLGAGTNLLVSDRGIRGLVLKLGRCYGDVVVDGCRVTAGASAQFGQLARRTAAAGLAGLEFAEGIPGSVGGGLVMNAGAFGGEMSRVVTAVHGVDGRGSLRRLRRDEVGFTYRKTSLPDGFIITQIDFELEPHDTLALAARVDLIHQRRAARQPDGVPNAGSIFKNPPGNFAGRLLEEAGLKGARQGGAAFSDRHANFIVNLGGASAREVRLLMEKARDRVRMHSGITLETEVRLVGEW